MHLFGKYSQIFFGTRPRNLSPLQVLIVLVQYFTTVYTNTFGYNFVAEEKVGVGVYYYYFFVDFNFINIGIINETIQISFIDFI